jgi:hypothetical protein
VGNSLLSSPIAPSQDSRLVRDESGTSPLGRVLAPKPDWRTINGYILKQPFTLADIEAVIGERAGDEDTRRHFFSHLLTADLNENAGRLTDFLFKEAFDNSAERAAQHALARAYFDMVHMETGRTPLFALIEKASEPLFTRALKLLNETTADNMMALDPEDPIAKLYQQVLLCRRMLRDDRQGISILFAALEAGTAVRIKALIALLLDVELTVQAKKDNKVETQNVTVDPHSPAPHNPLLALLLKRNPESNTIYHEVFLKRHPVAFDALTARVQPAEGLAILTKVPNKLGLTVHDFAERQTLKLKLNNLVEAGLLDRVISVELFERLRGTDKALVEAEKNAEARYRKRLMGRATKVRFNVPQMEAIAPALPDLSMEG